MGIKSIQVMSRPSSERRAVLFFECESDLAHHLVHFGVRQGALGAPESQGKCDALVPVRNLRAAVFVERPRALENVAAGLIDSGQKSRGGQVVLDHDGEISLDPWVSRPRLCSPYAGGIENPLAREPHRTQPAPRT